MAEGVAVKELKSPFQERQDAAQDTENNIANHTTNSIIGTGLALCDRTELAKELNNCNQQTTEADGTEAVGEGTFSCGTSCILGEVVDAEIPRSIYTSDDGVDGVLEPLGNPVHGKSDENKETNDFALATVLSSSTAIRIIWRWLPFNIDGHHGNREPSSKGSTENTTNQADEVDVSILLAYIDTCLEHKC